MTELQTHPELDTDGDGALSEAEAQVPRLPLGWGLLEALPQGDLRAQVGNQGKLPAGLECLLWVSWDGWQPLRAASHLAGPRMEPGRAGARFPRLPPLSLLFEHPVPFLPYPCPALFPSSPIPLLPTPIFRSPSPFLFPSFPVAPGFLPPFSALP